MNWYQEMSASWFQVMAPGNAHQCLAEVMAMLQILIQTQFSASWYSFIAPNTASQGCRWERRFCRLERREMTIGQVCACKTCRGGNLLKFSATRRQGTEKHSVLRRWRRSHCRFCKVARQLGCCDDRSCEDNIQGCLLCFFGAHNTTNELICQNRQVAEVN